MEFVKTPIPGCFRLLPRKLCDDRGVFVKTFNVDIFRGQNLESVFAEEYYSVSHKGVLRGLHFQLPPMDHIKLVYCIEGSVLDVVLDLRVGSPTYGQHALFELSAENGEILYIPRGLAHGFYTLSDDAIMVYKVSSIYSKEHDTGILWNSIDAPWPDQNPVISVRDQGFLKLSDFNSPFKFEA
jgi:dTDP-4-dehydrorhamnose 3,5-epimerase